MNQLRIGIIGTGMVARMHAEMYRNMPNAAIVAAANVVQSSLDAFCAEYAVPHAYLHYREMLQRDDLDSVDVCVYNNLHAPIAVDVLRAGMHCYCEKPIAGSYADAKAMLDASQALGRKLHVQLAMLFGSQPTAARKLIGAGLLGELYHARSVGYRRRDRPYADGYGGPEFADPYWAAGGALSDMGVYHISQMLHLLGNPQVRTISGSACQMTHVPSDRREAFRVEEFGVGLVRFQEPLTLDIAESWAVHGGSPGNSMIAGSKGGIEFVGDGFTGDKLLYYSEIEGYPGVMQLDLANETARQRRLDPSTRYLDSPQANWVGGLLGECELVDTASTAVLTALVTEGLYLSARKGREVSADEVIRGSKSNAITAQDSPIGRIEYAPYPFL